jgi:hypothetical protein
MWPQYTSLLTIVVINLKNIYKAANQCQGVTFGASKEFFSKFGQKFLLSSLLLIKYLEWALAIPRLRFASSPALPLLGPRPCPCPSTPLPLPRRCSSSLPLHEPHPPASIYPLFTWLLSKKEQWAWVITSNRDLKHPTHTPFTCSRRSGMHLRFNKVDKVVACILTAF